MNDLQSTILPTWCPGCGEYEILEILKDALISANLDMDNIVIVFDIGCDGNMANNIKCYGFHGLQGRSIPVAEGIRLANHKLNVFVVTGDGDGNGISLGHLLHAARRNFNLTYIVNNNQIYGLTSGKASSTSEEGQLPKSTPEGSIDHPLNPITLAISAGASFVARGFAGDGINLIKIIKAANEHKGFSLVNILNPCVTFNHHNTYDWFKERLYSLESEGHNPLDKIKALEKGQEWGDRIPWGIFYKEERATYEEQVHALKEKELVIQDISSIDISNIIEDFTI